MRKRVWVSGDNGGLPWGVLRCGSRVRVLRYVLLGPRVAWGLRVSVALRALPGGERCK